LLAGVFKAQSAPETLPVGETGGAKGKGGGSPGLHGAKRRKTGDTLALRQGQSPKCPEAL